MENFIIDFMDKFGYLAVFLLITLENIFPPIPSEIILTLGGFMTISTSMNVPVVILIATLGSVAGAIILYLVGRLISTERLEKILSGRTGRILHLNPEDVEKAKKWFLKCGNKAVFICRCIPIVRSLISLPAGSTKMSFAPFIVFTSAGTIIWNTVLVVLGRIAGNTWERIAGYFDTFSTIVLIVILIICAICGVLFLKARFLK
ncbi:MAG: DedA family protein [Oscillospiraceae bacterium]|jgi:membrane protein DedA with SNARE-associated domain|nr:DedA family protein [Oscillospiraceae bacterium]